MFRGVGGDLPNPVADAHRQTSAALRAKTKQPDLYGRSTTKDPYARSSPSPPRPALPQPKSWGPGGAKRFLSSVVISEKSTILFAKGSMLAEGSEPEPIDHRQRFGPLAVLFVSFAPLR